MTARSRLDHVVNRSARANTIRRAVLFTLAGTALIAACGDDDDAAGTEPEGT
jgi:hypothetical protein